LIRDIIYILILGLVTFTSCKSDHQKTTENKNLSSKESLIKANQKMVKSEDQRIEDYINRYKWKMLKTKTGLRYYIYHSGNGPQAETGKIATINYELKLLTGEVCYTSEENGPKQFLIGKGGIESGLEEGILFLKKSDRAKFIIPSHLAFGLVGDGKKIPAKATLVYDIELIELK
jgi:FKBP-type peptidyl-prolyl cis-trans isomerase